MGYYRSECFYFIHKLTKGNAKMLHLLYKSWVIIGVSVFILFINLPNVTLGCYIFYKLWVIIGVSVFILFISLPNI